MAASNFHIIITDRNSHVRELLFRELLREGYRVTEAKDCAQLLELLNSTEFFDLLVLDPELCGIRHCSRIDPGRAKVLLHALEDVDCTSLPQGLTANATCVEKTGDLDKLMGVLRDTLESLATERIKAEGSNNHNPGTDDV